MGVLMFIKVKRTGSGKPPPAKGQTMSFASRLFSHHRVTEGERPHRRTVREGGTEGGEGQKERGDRRREGRERGREGGERKSRSKEGEGV